MRRAGPPPAARRAWLAAWLLGALLGCAAPLPLVDGPAARDAGATPRPAPSFDAAPERATGSVAKPGWRHERFAVAAANPLAAEAGHRMLRAGGSALDAAVAVQMVLTLVEPQSSGIGGGALLMHWDGREVQAWDGRETAPTEADENLFLDANGRPLPFMAAVVGGRAVGVPGAVRMLEAAHRAHGRLPWRELFVPAIELAEQGFAVSPRLHALLRDEGPLRAEAGARHFYFLPDASALPVGTTLRNPALAEVLRALAARGSAALHEGPIAEDIVSRVRGHRGNPGRLQGVDLALYRALRRQPICTDWKAAYRICGFPPPSSGHLTLMQIAGILERLPGSAPVPLQAGVPGPEWLHRYAEAARLAYADRAMYVADPEYAAAPAGDWLSLLDDGYLRRRAALIGPRSAGVASAGEPGPLPRPQAAQAEQPEHGTSHISIVDGAGRALAMTTTIEAAFGSRILSDGGTGKPGGFLLNNQLTDFSFAPRDAQGLPVANRVQPGKRPRSSMSPTLVFDRRDGRLLMTLGSPGGATIIHYTAKALYGMLDWGLDAQQAIDLPNFGSLNGPTLLEAGRFPAATANALRERGHAVVEVELTSGLQAIQRVPGGWFGGADPRREGVVAGQ